MASLFERPLCKSEVLDQLRADTRLDPDLHRRALAVAEQAAGQPK